MNVYNQNYYTDKMSIKEYIMDLKTINDYDTKSPVTYFINLESLKDLKKILMLSEKSEVITCFSNLIRILMVSNLNLREAVLVKKLLHLRIKL